jgi:hypothetical protein
VKFVLNRSQHGLTIYDLELLYRSRVPHAILALMVLFLLLSSLDYSKMWVPHSALCWQGAPCAG